MTPTRRRVRVSKYIILVNHIGTKMGTKFLYLYFIDIKQFADVDLRVAQIVEASLVEGADKLLKLNLNVGELGDRQVFAGIKKAYNPEDLTNKLVILVSNLEPRQMKFGLSEGMVLASSDDEGIYLISPDSGAKPGLRVK